jgi:hypothetical protein
MPLCCLITSNSFARAISHNLKLLFRRIQGIVLQQWILLATIVQITFAQEIKITQVELQSNGDVVVNYTLQDEKPTTTTHQCLCQASWQWISLGVAVDVIIRDGGCYNPPVSVSYLEVVDVIRHGSGCH